MIPAGRGWGAGLASHGLLLGTSMFVLAPFVWMLALSIKPPGEIASASLSLIPSQFYGLENYGQALGQAHLWQYMLNGALVCAATLALQIVVAAPASYALAKFAFRGQSLVFAAVLVSLALPKEAIAAPLFMLCHLLGIIDTYAALILPNVVSPFAIFLLRQSFKVVPDELISAARLDGFGHLAIIWRILLPAAIPGLATFSVLSIVARWNDLFWPSIVIFSDHLMPPTVGLVRFRNNELGSDYGPLMAAAVIVVAPLVILSILAQRSTVAGPSEQDR